MRPASTLSDTDFANKILASKDNQSYVREATLAKERNNQKGYLAAIDKIRCRRNNGLNYQENRCHSKLSSPEFGTSPDSGFTSHEGVTLTVFLMNQYRRMLHISVHWRFNHDCKT